MKPAYRTDRIIRRKNGQLVGYVDWIGGPTISRVTAVCPDGHQRWAFVTGEPLTLYSLPAYISVGSTKVSGYIFVDDSNVWMFRPCIGKEPEHWIPARACRIPAHIKTIQDEQ